MAPIESPIPDDLPICIEPRYRTSAPNAAIPLYEGRATVAREADTCDAQACVALNWLPTPHVEIRVSGHYAHDFISNRPFTASLAERGANSLSVDWTSFLDSQGNSESSWAVGTVDDGVLPKDEEVASILFHISNGPKFNGFIVRDATCRHAHHGRAVFSTGPWNVTIDSLREQFVSKGATQLEDSGGYAITHVGKLSRLDLASFRAADAEPLLFSLGWFLSFSRGAWCRPLLFVGLEANGESKCEAWNSSQVAPAHSRKSWFDETSMKGFEGFAGLHDRLSDAMWREPIELALHWYVIANNPKETSLEGSIVLQQAAFELLAWTLLVEDRRVLSEDGASKLPASDKVRLLLAQCGLPLAIPAELKALTDIAAEYNWCDGPSATTEIRNALVHANPKKRARVLGKGAATLFDAWVLGQWYLDLILLRLFRYEGSYLNRLKRDVWKTEAIESVPWAIEAEQLNR